MLPWVATVQWWCGQRDSARALLTRMKTLPHARENGYRMAIVHTLFGEKDSAFVWLDRQHWTMAELSGLSADWFLQPLRSDPPISGAAAAPRRSTSVVNSPTRLRLRVALALIATVIAPAAGPRLGSQSTTVTVEGVIRGIDGSIPTGAQLEIRGRETGAIRAQSVMLVDTIM